MENLAGFDFLRLGFDEKGNAEDTQQLPALTGHIQGNSVTDVIFLAHGFRNNESDATGLYTRFLTSFRDDVDGRFHDRLGGRKFATVGTYWPSKPFREEGDVAAQSLDSDLLENQALQAQIDDLKSVATTPEQLRALDQASVLMGSLEDSDETQDRFADLVRTVLNGHDVDATEGIDKFQSLAGSELLDKIGGLAITGARSADDEGGALAVPVTVSSASGAATAMALDLGQTQGAGSFFQNLAGRVGQFLNLTLWYVMKNRSGVVGANGATTAVRAVAALANAPRIHLVGHSLGGRLMASCAKALAQEPRCRPDSLTLLEAAFSHYGFSAANGFGRTGFFRAVMDPQPGIVKGPVLVTFSAKDDVVGHIYAIASRVADDNAEALGDKDDEFGGIGRNGPQKSDDVALQPENLRPADSPQEYDFHSGKVISLDGSGGLIANHGDVTSPAISFAFSCALTKT